MLRLTGYLANKLNSSVWFVFLLDYLRETGGSWGRYQTGRYERGQVDRWFESVNAKIESESEKEFVNWAKLAQAGFKWIELRLSKSWIETEQSES